MVSFTYVGNRHFCKTTCFELCEHSGNVAASEIDKGSTFMEDNMLVRKTSQQDNC